MDPAALQDRQEVPWLVGHVVMATSGLERQLSLLVVALAHAPLAEEIVRGQRGSDSINVARRVLRADQSRDEAELPPFDSLPARLPATLVQEISEHLSQADTLLSRRDEVAHSLWMGVAVDADREHIAVRIRRAGATENRWTPEALRGLYQGIVNTTVDLYTDTVNTRSARTGMTLWPSRGNGDIAPLPDWSA